MKLDRKTAFLIITAVVVGLALSGVIAFKRTESPSQG
jgi:hypothetical protein